jgi:hypothetical protein
MHSVQGDYLVVCACPSDERLPLTATLASPQSGSTLFAIVLAAHPQLCSDGETFPLEDINLAKCSCGQAQLDCPYYRQAGAHFLGSDGKQWDPSLFVPYPTYSRFALVDSALGRLWSKGSVHFAQNCLRCLVPWCRRQDSTFLAAHVQFMKNSLQMRQARVYVDGSKSVRRANLFASCAAVRMKVMHLIRDGRGYCFSHLRSKALPIKELPAAAGDWLKNIEAVDRFHARWPQIPMLEVRYEDLCQDLPGTMRRVCQFLEVPYDPAVERPDARTCHILGNSMRLNFSGQVQQSLRWQQEFAPEQIRFLNRVLGPSLERFRYSI